MAQVVPRLISYSFGESFQFAVMHDEGYVALLLLVFVAGLSYYSAGINNY